MTVTMTMTIRNRDYDYYYDHDRDHERDHILASSAGNSIRAFPGKINERIC